MRTKVAGTNGVWTVYGNDQQVATFPSRKLARDYARELHKCNSVEEFMKNTLGMTDEQIAQRVNH